MKRTVVALATLAAACAPAKPAAETGGRKDVESLPGPDAPLVTESGGAEPSPGFSTGQGPTTTVAVASTTSTSTTVAPFVMPEAKTEESDAEWWADQPGYSGAMPLPPAWVSQRESGDDYTAVNPAGYYGRWQFGRSTWDATAEAAGRADLVGVRPDQASPADQDAMAAELWDSGAGCAHWAAC